MQAGLRAVVVRAAHWIKCCFLTICSVKAEMQPGDAGPGGVLGSCRWAWLPSLPVSLQPFQTHLEVELQTFHGTFRSQTG